MKKKIRVRVKIRVKIQLKKIKGFLLLWGYLLKLIN